MSREDNGMERSGREGLQRPERPTLKALAGAWGEPPWTYVLPRPELLPDEAIELIGAVELGGVRFVREEAS